MGKKFVMPEVKQAALKANGVQAQEVAVGVRPVHVQIGDTGIAARIDVSEMMGSELHLHMTAGTNDVVAVVPTANIDTTALSNHSEVKFDFDPKLMHLFNKETEKNLI